VDDRRKGRGGTKERKQGEEEKGRKHKVTGKGNEKKRGK